MTDKQFNLVLRIFFTGLYILVLIYAWLTDGVGKLPSGTGALLSVAYASFFVLSWFIDFNKVDRVDLIFSGLILIGGVYVFYAQPSNYSSILLSYVGSLSTIKTAFSFVYKTRVNGGGK